MSDSSIALDNLNFGLALAGNAQSEAQEANRRAQAAELRASEAELAAARVTTDRDLELRLEEATRREVYATNTVDILKDELAEKDALITEWMHSNEAFKTLSVKYAKKLGLASEDHDKDFCEQIIETAAVDPLYAHTELLSKIQARLA